MTPATPDRARAAASAELGRIAEEAEREAFDSDNSHVVRSLHARYAASLRAVAAGIESATAGDALGKS